MNERLLGNEQDIETHLSTRNLPVDLASMHAIADIYRAAAAVRRTAERDVLADHQLSWGGFTILWVVWVWGPMETARLAAECDLAKGTLTGMVTTLEKQGFVEREKMSEDRRRVTVSLTEHGTRTIEHLQPAFNAFEQKMTVGLTEGQKSQLADLLRIVITNADDDTL